jgi:hypothetical protein
MEGSLAAALIQVLLVKSCWFLERLPADGMPLPLT